MGDFQFPYLIQTDHNQLFKFLVLHSNPPAYGRHTKSGRLRDRAGQDRGRDR